LESGWYFDLWDRGENLRPGIAMCKKIFYRGIKAERKSQNTLKNKNNYVMVTLVLILKSVYYSTFTMIVYLMIL
jgi:hypothetical protein